MQSGPLRHRLEIQTVTETRDSYGGISQAWTTLETRWANIQPMSSRELWQAQQAQSQATHKITMRYYSGLTEKHRLKVSGGTRVFNIASVINPDERKIMHEIQAIEET